MSPKGAVPRPKFRLRSFGTAAKFTSSRGSPAALMPAWYRFDLFSGAFLRQLT
ncbi:hypothetical protein D9X30_5257 [Cupriavidus sp. U2]|nr:hypothetical protein D9X30_5257 [Cupriavidus sp. U2]